MGFIGKKELYTILCTGIGDYSSDSLELNVDITPDFVVRNIDKYNFVYKIEVVDGSTLIREFGFPKLESEVVSVITPTWIFEHENNTLKITGSSGSGEGLPDISGANIGDVLTVGENGAEWSAPSGEVPALKTIRAIAPEESLVYTMDTLYTDVVSFYNAGIPMCVAIGRIIEGSFLCEQFFFITYLSDSDGEIYAMGSTGGQPFGVIFVNSQSGYPKYDVLG